MIWIAFALLTVASVLSVVLPLARKSRLETPQTAAVDFYQAQVTAIEQDRNGGLIAPADVGIAMNEAARRLLASKAKAPATPANSLAGARAAAILAVIAIPAISLLLYFRIGNPDLPDRPLTSRNDVTAEPANVAALTERMEKRLAENPRDGKGFALLAPVYMRLGRPGDAVKAYARALELLGDNTEMRANYAEAMVAASNGQVIPEAARNFALVIKADPSDSKARFYLGMAAEQSGNKDEALVIFNNILKDAPPDAPYLSFLSRHIFELTGKYPQMSPSSAANETTTLPPGAEAVVNLPDQERQAMIRSMVDGLAARLAANGSDGPGWLRLIRALSVLHEDERARKAVTDARVALAGDAATLKSVNDLAGELGLSVQ